MAVTITKKFWNGSEYKDIAKIVFTSPNFTSPAVAGTRSHMQPGGQYMGTWFEAVDWMYREKVDQDYADFPNEMESFFGKLTLSGTFDLDNDSSALFTHRYGEDYDVVGDGTYSNILYKNKNNYATILACVSGTISGTSSLYTANVTFSNVVGSGIMNSWIGKTASGTINKEVGGNASPVGETTTIDIDESVTAQANDDNNTILTGNYGGTIAGTMSSGSSETVSGTLTDTFSGRLTKISSDGLATEVHSTVSDSIIIVMTGHDYGTASGTMTTTFSGFVGEAGSTLNATVSDVVTAQTDDSHNVTVTGTVNGNVSCTVNDAGGNFVSGTLVGPVSGNLIGDDGGDFVQSNVTGNASIYFFGNKNSILSANSTCPVTGLGTGVISGTLNSSFSGAYEEPSAIMFHQYSNEAIDGDTTLPRLKRHHGSNSIIFTVTFGEAYDCRLTAWDDDTHSTTTNKVLIEEHYRVDAVAYRSNIVDTAHAPIFRKNSSLIYPSVYDLVLKGNERYYGDFDLIFAIEADEFGEYLAFIPRLVNMDDSFTAGSYDFVTTLHYQYT